MKPGRWAGALLILLVLALASLHLRAEQSRCAARVLKSEAERIALRAELWQLQTSVARLKSPLHVHDRLRRLADTDRTEGGGPSTMTHEALALTDR